MVFSRNPIWLFNSGKKVTGDEERKNPATPSPTGKSKTIGKWITHWWPEEERWSDKDSWVPGGRHTTISPGGNRKGREDSNYDMPKAVMLEMGFGKDMLSLYHGLPWFNQDCLPSGGYFNVSLKWTPTLPGVKVGCENKCVMTGI